LTFLVDKLTATARRWRANRRTQPDEAGPPASRALFAAFVEICRLVEQPFSVDQIVAAASLDDQRMTPGSLRLAAERLGFVVRNVEPTVGNLETMPTPFLLVGRQPDEAWVVRRRAKDHLLVFDPQSEQTSACALGTVADMAARAVLLKAGRRAAGERRWRDVLLRRVRPVLWEIGIASVVINLLALATPIFLMTVYNKVINHAALATLDVLALGMVTLLVFDGILRALRGHIAGHTGARLDAALGSDVVHHLAHLPLRTFETLPTGQILERARQLDTLRHFFTGQMPLLLVDLAFVGLFLAVLFYLDTRLGWLVLLAMPAFWLLSLLAARRQRPLVEAGFRAAAAKVSALGETVSQALTVKALGLEPEMERRFKQRLAESAWTGFRASNHGAVIAGLGHALQHLVALLVIYIGARAIVAGEMSIGALIAATILTARALAPMRHVVGAWHQLQTVRDAFARLDELMSEPVEHRHPPMPTTTIRGHIRFDQVTYRYADDGQPALAGIDLEIEPGRTHGVIGPPGSGKSTLVKLLLGLDRPDRGRVLIDGVDVRLFSSLGLRQQIGVVPQDVQLFGGTIGENIAMGAADRSMERIVAAAKFVGAHDFIQRLPQGYDTLLTERGGGLSAGQRQLISIARALIRNPRVLVLDEATSALDPATEEALLANLKRASRGRTLILITHRLAALAIAERVVYLADGRIERRGSPGDVLSYARSRGAPGGPVRPHLAPV